MSAGPGWGKTLAAASWAASDAQEQPVAWVSLDDRDNDPRRFWSYFVAALRSLDTISPSDPLAQLAPGLGDEEEFLRRLLAGLSQLRSSVVVVLDDLHLVREPAVLAGLTELLRHPVDQLRLVTLTRADPTLPLHRLRMNEDLAEIRGRDLAFDVVSAGALLARHGVQMGTADAQRLVDRTEGWPAGLRLAALFLRRPGEPRRVADFAGDDRNVAGYLADEVLGSQPADLRRFLLRTSVAERLSSELAEVLTGEAHSQRYLEELEASNAFVVGLGPGRQWFRYHALLREMLRHRLMVDEPDALPELHRVAAGWFAENGHPLEALGHSADAGDWPLLGRLFVTHALPLLVSIDRAALDQVLARIPASHLADGPELALCAAARLFHAGLFQDMQPHLELATARLDEGSPDARDGIRLAVLLLSLPMTRERGDVGSVMDISTEALDLVSQPGSIVDADSGVRTIALGNLGAALLWAGQVGAAGARLEEGLAVVGDARIDVAKVNVLAHRALAAVETGDLPTAIHDATQALETVDARGWVPLIQAATAYLALAMVDIKRNNIAEAQLLLAQGMSAALREPASRLAIGLAQVRLAASLAKVPEARALLEQLRDEIGEWQVPLFLARWLALTEAEVDLASGDPVAAVGRIAPGTNHEAPFASERVVLARAHLAMGDAEAADGELVPLRDGGVAPSDASSQVEVWLLTALAADVRREDNRAVEAMRRSVLAARRDAIRRPFVTLGDGRVVRLLLRLKEIDPASAVATADLVEYLQVVPGDGSTTTLTEPLTDRELMVLRFLPTMMTNTEIAAELFVSVNTVKAHLKHIYRKLDVETRRQAAQRARELALLSDPAGQ